MTASLDPIKKALRNEELLLETWVNTKYATVLPHSLSSSVCVGRPLDAVTMAVSTMEVIDIPLWAVQDPPRSYCVVFTEGELE